MNMKLNEIMFQIQKMIMKNLIKFGFRYTFRFLIDFHKDNELRLLSHDSSVVSSDHAVRLAGKLELRARDG